MKNRIKGAVLTLLMLFGALYPSGQAYANGLSRSILPAEHLTLTEKQVLIKELVNDKEFILFYNQSLIVGLYLLNEHVYNEETKTVKSEINIEEGNSSIVANKNLFNNQIKLHFDEIVHKLLILKNNIVINHPKLNNVNDEDMNDIFAAVDPGVIARTAYLKCVNTFALAFVYQQGPKLMSVIWTSIVCATSATYAAGVYIKGLLPTACTDLKDPTRCAVFANLFKICFKANITIANIAFTEAEAISGGNLFFERFIKCLSVEVGATAGGINAFFESVLNPTKNTVLPTTAPTPAPIIDPVPNP